MFIYVLFAAFIFLYHVFNPCFVLDGTVLLEIKNHFLAGKWFLKSVV
jgi:hypothetical protein